VTVDNFWTKFVKGMPSNWEFEGIFSATIEDIVTVGWEAQLGTQGYIKDPGVFLL